jgi:hypothetical protein
MCRNSENRRDREAERERILPLIHQQMSERYPPFG